MKESRFFSIVPLFVLAHCAHHIITALPTPMLPYIRDEFGLDYTRAGLLMSVFSFAYGFSQLPAGWLSDHIHPRILLTIGIAGVGLCGLFIGLSTDYLILMFGFVLLGIAGGGYHPAAPPLIAATVSEEKRGRALGLHLVGGSFSFFLVPLIAAAIAGAMGWHSAFIWLSVPTLTFGVIMYLILKRNKIGDRLSVDNEISHETSHEISDTPVQWSLVIPFIALSSSIVAVTISMSNYIPLFVIDKFGINNETAVALLSIINSCGLWASVIGGYLSDRINKVVMLVILTILESPLLILLNFAPYGICFWALLVGMGMFLYFRAPTTESFIIGHTTSRNRSTVLGIYYFAGTEVAGVLTPGVGYLIDHFGFATAFYACGGFLLLAVLVLTPFIWNKRYQ